jgi:hypothetical protein
MDGGAVARISSDAAGLVTRPSSPMAPASRKPAGNLYIRRDA